jgi:hypothetical protein
LLQKVKFLQYNHHTKNNKTRNKLCPRQFRHPLWLPVIMLKTFLVHILYLLLISQSFFLHKKNDYETCEYKNTLDDQLFHTCFWKVKMFVIIFLILYNSFSYLANSFIWVRMWKRPWLELTTPISLLDGSGSNEGLIETSEILCFTSSHDSRMIQQIMQHSHKVLCQCFRLLQSSLATKIQFSKQEWSNPSDYFC